MAKTLLEIDQLLRAGDADAANVELRALLEREPNNAEAWYLLGSLLRRQQLWGMQ